MDALTEARRAALRRFVASEGGNAAVAEKYRLSTSRQSYLSQLTTSGSTAPFGERSARNWQELFGMTGDPLVHPEVAEAIGASLPTTAATIDRLGDILRSLSEGQREVVAPVLSSYARHPIPELGKALVTLMALPPTSEN
ncbi:hypothetical protein [Variovorax paradoxus]|uniref:hypothetical protein n=1 Tax=Variovorax paradoxus TaxID=34073 RepID=UPI001ABC1030